MHTVRFASIAFVTLLSGAVTARWARADGPAEAPAKSPFADIKFEPGPIDGKLEDIATIKVPEGVAFVGGRAESKKFMVATENLVSNQEVGILVPTVDGESWWMSFEFDPIGYVKDEDQDLDASKLLTSMTEATERGNAERKNRGWEELHIVGWHTAPRYNPSTHNLEWATKLRSTTGENVNYNVRLLGRRGVMSVTLVASQDQLEPMIARMQTLIAGFAYTPEQSYAAFKPGDKVAEYGLAALIAGGTLAVAAKSGLLGKFWKLLVAGGVALAAGLRKLFGGKKKVEPTV